MTETYDDGTIGCGPDPLEIGCYYFPHGPESVPDVQIQGLQRIEVTGPRRRRRRAAGENEVPDHRSDR